MSDLDQRIDAMFRRDKLGAWLLVVLLWITILAVLLLSWPYVPDTGVRVLLVIGALAVLIFNTASIAAMLSHYATDKQFIYGLDIRALDAMKARK
jgi:polyferredoxin